MTTLEPAVTTGQYDELLSCENTKSMLRSEWLLLSLIPFVSKIKTHKY